VEYKRLVELVTPEVWETIKRAATDAIMPSTTLAKPRSSAPLENAVQRSKGFDSRNFAPKKKIPRKEVEEYVYYFKDQWRTHHNAYNL
jgi:hypothetical protein